jgi:hypothetical protein
MEAKIILVADVLKAISDNRFLELFRTVALTKQDTDILISKTKSPVNNTIQECLA